VVSVEWIVEILCHIIIDINRWTTIQGYLWIEYPNRTVRTVSIMLITGFCNHHNMIDDRGKMSVVFESKIIVFHGKRQILNKNICHFFSQSHRWLKSPVGNSGWGREREREREREIPKIFYVICASVLSISLSMSFVRDLWKFIYFYTYL